MRVIQLRGTNATGKTTAIRQFINRGRFEVRSESVHGKEIEYHYDPERNIVVLGRYDKSVSGGIDGRITNKNLLRDAIIKILRNVKPQYLLFEGIVYGVTFKFAWELYRVLLKMNVGYIGICLMPPLDVAFERLSERNNGKPVDLLSVQNKYFTAARAVEMMDAKGIPVKVIDTSKIPKDKMYRIIEAEL